MRKIQFSTSSRLPMAAYAIAKDGESDIDAVQRSIERTTKSKAYTCRSESWTQDRNGKKDSETFAITLTEKTPVRKGSREYGVVAEIRVTI